MSESVPLFRYEDRLEGQNIRLIRLLKTKPDSSRLEIKLETHPLDGTEFDALSYVWGDQSETREIICNEMRFQIGVNLYEALNERRVEGATALRRAGDTFDTRDVGPYQFYKELVWADAICINQSDFDEKTQQVRMMRDIYANANQVIVWLGERQPEDAEAIGFAVWLFENFEKRLNVYSSKVPEGGDFRSAASKYPHILETPEWRRVFELLSHPWFGRIWVVQELLVGKLTIVQRGSIFFGIDVLLWMALLIMQYRDLNLLASGFDCGQAMSMAQFRRRYKEIGPIPLFGWLRGCMGMNATDPRDMFFALVGISHSVHPAFLDYSQELSTVACWVGAEALIGNPSWPELQHGLDCLAINANPENRKWGIPSWVPDWFSKGRRGQLDLAAAYMTSKLSNHRFVPNPEIIGIGFGGVELTTHPVIRSTFTMTMPLEFKVSAVDRVQSIIHSSEYEWPKGIDAEKGKTSKNPDVMAAYEKQLLTWLRDVRCLANPSLPVGADITSGDDFESFWRTLIYNFDPNMSRGQVSMHASFCYWFMWKRLFLICHQSRDMERFLKHASLLNRLAIRFDSAFNRFNRSRDFFVSYEGRIGWVPIRTEQDDQVFIFQGSRIPFIARPVGEDGWEYIGPCYVHGLMDGEAWDLAENQWWFMKLV